MRNPERIPLHAGETSLLIALLIENGLGLRQILPEIHHIFHSHVVDIVFNEFKEIEDWEACGDLLSRASLKVHLPEEKALLNQLSVACYSVIDIGPPLRSLFANFRAARSAGERAEIQLMDHFCDEFQRSPDQPSKWIDLVKSTPIDPSFRQARILQASLAYLSQTSLSVMMEWTRSLQSYQDIDATSAFARAEISAFQGTLATYISHAFQQNIPFAILGSRREGLSYWETLRQLREAGYVENGAGPAIYIDRMPTAPIVENWQDIRASLRIFSEDVLKDLVNRRGQIIVFDKKGDFVAVAEVIPLEGSEVPYGVQAIFWRAEGKIAAVGMVPSFWKNDQNLFAPSS